MAAKKKVAIHGVTLNNDCNVLDARLNHGMHPALEIPELLAIIFYYLSVADRGRAAQVCVVWRKACNQSLVWRGVECCTLFPGHPIPAASLQQRRIPKIEISYFDSLPLSASSDELICEVPEGLSFEFTDYTGAIMQDIGLPCVTHLGISFCPILTDANMELITHHMPHLVYLDLSFCRPVTDNALLYIALRLRKLDCLNLTHCKQVTHEGIGYLAGRIDRNDATIDQLLKGAKLYDDVDRLMSKGLPIVTLNLYGCKQVANEALQYLSGLTELQRLNLSNCQQFDSKGMVHLAAIPNLLRLDMYRCDGVTDASIVHLAEIPTLLELHLSCCRNITDAGLGHLAQRRPMITCLDISNCENINRNVLYFIANKFRHLQYLTVDIFHFAPSAWIQLFTNLRRLKEFRFRNHGYQPLWEKYVLPSDFVAPRDFDELIEFTDLYRRDDDDDD